MDVDFVLSCGAACRPAYYAKKLCLRKFSSPCDWMMNYSLRHYVDILRTEGQFMFQSAKYDDVNKWVCDTGNGMISMHDFNYNQPLEAQLPAFYEKMVRRTKNTINRISQSRRVGIIMNRNIDKGKIIEFADSMKLLFPKCFFYIVNVRDIPNQESIKTEYIIETEKYTITEISFNDAHKNGRDKSQNGDFWLGNVSIWKKIMLSHFHVKGSRYLYIKTQLKQKPKWGIYIFIRVLKRFISTLMMRSEGRKE